MEELKHDAGNIGTENFGGPEMSPVSSQDPEGILENILSDGEELLDWNWTGSGFCSTKSNHEAYPF